MYIPPVARILKDDGGFERTVELTNGAQTIQTWVGDEEDGEWMQVYDEFDYPIRLNPDTTLNID
jgi:hypothetical protein